MIYFTKMEVQNNIIKDHLRKIIELTIECANEKNDIVDASKSIMQRIVPNSTEMDDFTSLFMLVGKIALSKHYGLKRVYHVVNSLRTAVIYLKDNDKPLYELLGSPDTTLLLTDAPRSTTPPISNSSLPLFPPNQNSLNEGNLTETTN